MNVVSEWRFVDEFIVKVWVSGRSQVTVSLTCAIVASMDFQATNNAVLIKTTTGMSIL